MAVVLQFRTTSVNDNCFLTKEENRDYYATKSKNDGDSDWCQQLLVSAAAAAAACALPQPGVVADGFLNLP